MFFIAASFWGNIEKLDQRLFLSINNGLSNPFFDALMPYLRSSVFWVPLYLFSLVFMLFNYGIRGLWWCLFFVSTVALTDMTGQHMFKELVKRVRPCNDQDILTQVRMVVECGTGHSFISNHAANHFGMAVFFIMTCKPILKNWVWLALVWAAIIAFAQVYVGVHYPFDVIAGALVGAAWAYLIAHAFNKRFGFTIFGNQPVA